VTNRLCESTRVNGETRVAQLVLGLCHLEISTVGTLRPDLPPPDLLCMDQRSGPGDLKLFALPPALNVTPDWFAAIDQRIGKSGRDFLNHRQFAIHPKPS